MSVMMVMFIAYCGAGHVHDDEGMHNVRMDDVADAQVVAAHVDDDGDVHVGDHW